MNTLTVHSQHEEVSLSDRAMLCVKDYYVINLAIVIFNSTQ